MRVLVTGGAGFIGSHLSERLLRDGHKLAIIDELNDFYPPEEKLANLESIRQHGEYRFWKADIIDAKPISEIFAEFRPEVVVHLAARAGVRPSLAAPVLYEQANVIGTLNLLEASRKMPGDSKPRFIFGSSSSVYGISKRVPFSEDDPLECPVSPYAVSKLAGEKYCFSYNHLYGLQTICLRFFTVYGPRQRPDLAIRKFAERILAGKTIPIFGDGSTARDYTFVEDIVEGILAAFRCESGHRVFNLGNSNPVRLHTLVETLGASLGKEVVREVLPEQPGDVPVTFADLSRSRAELGYSPKVNFETGIARFTQWVKSPRVQVSA